MSDWERPAIEKTTKFATSVEGLDEAFAFVMNCLTQVDDVLNIEIKPFWSSSDDFSVKRFSVAVSGMIELPAYQPEGLT
jgi:hypothetical protein